MKRMRAISQKEKEGKSSTSNLFSRKYWESQKMRKAGQIENQKIKLKYRYEMCI